MNMKQLFVLKAGHYLIKKLKCKAKSEHKAHSVVLENKTLVNINNNLTKPIDSKLLK